MAAMKSFQEAVNAEDSKALTVLLENGSFTMPQLTSVLHAVLHKVPVDEEKIRMLLEQGASVIYQEEEQEDDLDEMYFSRGPNALHVALVKHSDLSLVRLITEVCEPIKLEQMLTRNCDEYGEALNIAITKRKDNPDIALEIYALREIAHNKAQRKGPMIPVDLLIHHLYDSSGYLSQAAYYGHVKLTKMMIEAVPQDKKQTCLNCAFRNAVQGSKNVDFVRELLQMGAEVDSVHGRSRRKDTALGHAIQNNDINMVRMLMNEFNADIHMVSSAMVKAIGTKNLEIVNLLIDRGVDVNRYEQYICDRTTPFMMALRYDSLEIVKRLVVCGAKIRCARFEEVIRPLHLSVCQRNSACLPYLLENFRIFKKDINLGCQKVGTPLTLACRYGYSANAQCLLTHGADVNKADKCHKTPLLCAIRSISAANIKHTLSIIIKLLQYGADPSLRSPLHELPLEVALGLRLLPVAVMLWDAGSEPCQTIKWFIQPSGLELYPKEQLKEFVEKVTKQPRTLQNLTRNYVRKVIGPKNVMNAVDKLLLPQNLQDYINLSDLKMHRKRMIPEYRKKNKKWCAANVKRLFGNKYNPEDGDESDSVNSDDDDDNGEDNHGNSGEESDSNSDDFREEMAGWGWTETPSVYQRPDRVHSRPGPPTVDEEDEIDSLSNDSIDMYILRWSLTDYENSHDGRMLGDSDSESGCED